MKKHGLRKSAAVLGAVLVAAGYAAWPHLGGMLTSAGLFSIRLNDPNPKELQAQLKKESAPSPTQEVTTAKAAAPTVTQAVQVFKKQDSEDLAETPADILKLQQQAKKALSGQQKAGNITEGPYSGGGTALSYGKVKVQSHIPASFYNMDIAKLLKQGPDLSIADKSKPTVLIYHTHTTESYENLDVGYYTKQFQERKDDKKQNMVRVGDAMVEQLEKAGFKAIHDTTIYDKNYTGAYDRSDITIKKYLEQYPSIDVTIDVHRDSIKYENGTKVKPTVKINGKKAAQIMIIAGCEYGKVKNFPDWEHNLRFDLKLQEHIETTYPGLMRPVYFGQRKYNMFETHNSLLMEFGSEANTLEEAVYSGRLAGKALASMLENYVKG